MKMKGGWDLSWFVWPAASALGTINGCSLHLVGTASKRHQKKKNQTFARNLLAGLVHAPKAQRPVHVTTEVLLNACVVERWDQRHRTQHATRNTHAREATKGGASVAWGWGVKWVLRHCSALILGLNQSYALTA